jgi:hypothetical protein
MQNCAFGAVNRVLTATLTADQQVAALPVTNLQTDQGDASHAWRVAANNGLVTLKLTAADTWQAFSFHRTNLTATASWWVEVSNAGTVVYRYGQAGANQPTNIKAGQFVHVAPAPVTGDQVRIQVYDPNTVDGFLSLPLMYAGPIWQPVRNMSWQGDEDTDSGVDEVTSLGGQEYPQFRYARRVLTIDHQSLGQAELPVIRAVSLLGLQGRNILFLPNPSAATLNSDALFGRLTPSSIGNPAGSADRRNTKFTLKERI